MAAAATGTTEPRIAVADDGSLIAHLRPDRVELVDGATLAVLCEIGIDPDALGCDVLLTGDPLRLVVLARYASSARLHVVDPRGPSAVGELALRAAMRMPAASGDHVWLVGAGGASVVDIVRSELTLAPLPLRGPVSAVGSLTSGRFVVSTGGLLEEWDPETRAPARRFRLGKPTAARFVGGGARQVWLVTSEGDRVEVLPLVNTGQPSRLALPEPVVRVHADHGQESLVAIGAQTGAAYVVDLTGRNPPVALDGVVATDLAWLGSHPSVVVVDADDRLELVPVAGRLRPGMGLDRPTTTAPRPAMLSQPAPVGRAAEASGASAGEIVDAAAVSPADRLDGSSTWRDELAAWARAVLAGGRPSVPTIVDGPAAEIALRLGLRGDLAHALWLVYGAHLAGVDGVAALDLISVLGHRWDEALGRGDLAATGALRWRRSRIRLVAEVRRALDSGPIRGAAWIASEAKSPDAAVAVIAADDADLIALATELAPTVGALLVARTDGRPHRHQLEARVRGALPVLRWPPDDGGAATPPRALLVVTDEATARAAGAPLIARWSAD